MEEGYRTRSMGRENEPARVVPDIEDMVDSSGRLLNQQPAYDRLINAEVQLQLGENMTSAKVKARALDSNGSLVRNYHDNPMMNSIIYEVEFPDGQVKEYSANTIAENMLARVDSNGFTMTLMKGMSTTGETMPQQSQKPTHMS